MLKIVAFGKAYFTDRVRLVSDLLLLLSLNLCVINNIDKNDLFAILSR